MKCTYWMVAVTLFALSCGQSSDHKSDPQGNSSDANVVDDDTTVSWIYSNEICSAGLTLSGCVRTVTASSQPDTYYSCEQAPGAWDVAGCQEVSSDFLAKSCTKQSYSDDDALREVHHRDLKSCLEVGEDGQVREDRAPPPDCSDPLEAPQACVQFPDGGTEWRDRFLDSACWLTDGAVIVDNDQCS